MKKLLAMFVVFFAVWTVSAQRYVLPIGSYVNYRQATIKLEVGGYGVWVEETISYVPAMGDLASVIRNRLWMMAEGWNPPVGRESENGYAVSVVTTPGPFGLNRFQPQRLGNRWVVPTEALEVELVYGSASILAQGITGVEVEVRGGGRTEKFSTIARTGGTACEIDTTLGDTFVVIHRRFAVPKYREPWWNEGEVTLWAGEQFARFNILDGSLMETSAEPPAFLSQLVAPAMPPRITSIQRVGEFTEISVAVADGTKVILEFSEDFKKWVRVDPPTVTLASAGSRSLAHQPPAGAKVCFYRVIAVEPVGPALKSTP